MNRPNTPTFIRNTSVPIWEETEPTCSGAVSSAQYCFGLQPMARANTMHSPNRMPQNRFTVSRDATSRVSAPGAAGSSMPMVLNSVALRKNANRHTGTAAEYRSKPLCTFGEWVNPAGRKKPMAMPTIIATTNPYRLKPTTSG